MITKVCKICNKEFKIFNYRRTSLFCSLKCYWKDLKNRPSLRKKARIIIYCICGCGKQREFSTVKGRGFKYIKGHNKPWLGKKRLNISGEKNNFWKGGITKHPDYIKIRNKNRRYRKRNAKGSFTVSEWQTLKEKFCYACPMCHKEEPKIKLTVDHIIPLIKGGTNYIDNIQPLCFSCNSKKRTKIIRFLPCAS